VPTMEDFVFLFFGQSDEAKKAGAQFWVRRHQRVDQDPPSSAASHKRKSRLTLPTSPRWRVTSPMRI
jgi:hypothetical protein